MKAGPFRKQTLRHQFWKLNCSILCQNRFALFYVTHRVSEDFDFICVLKWRAGKQASKQASMHYLLPLSCWNNTQFFLSCDPPASKKPFKVISINLKYVILNHSIARLSPLKILILSVWMVLMLMMTLGVAGIAS